MSFQGSPMNPHVVTAIINEKVVRNVLPCTTSVVNVITLQAAKRLGLRIYKETEPTILDYLNGSTKRALGFCKTFVELYENVVYCTLFVTDVPMPYNMLLGCSFFAASNGSIRGDKKRNILIYTFRDPLGFAMAESYRPWIQPTDGHSQPTIFVRKIDHKDEPKDEKS